MGRHIRFEAAKAFRTLYLSFRNPMKFIPDSPEGSNESGHWVKGEIPKEMRIWKPADARLVHFLLMHVCLTNVAPASYPIVSYNALAQLPEHARLGLNPDDLSGDSILAVGGAYFEDLVLDQAVSVCVPLI